MHRVVSIPNPSATSKAARAERHHPDQRPASTPAPQGDPSLNVQGQVIAIAMAPPAPVRDQAGLASKRGRTSRTWSSRSCKTGRVVVSSLGSSPPLSSVRKLAALYNLPAGQPDRPRSRRTGRRPRAGLQPGDVITQLDDVKVDAAHPLSLVLRSRFPAPASGVAITYNGGGKNLDAGGKLTPLGASIPPCYMSKSWSPAALR